MGWVDSAGLMLSNAMQRVETSAHNVANLATPGFKSYRSGEFQKLIRNTEGSGQSQGTLSVDFSAGKLRSTANPFDLAILGNGFFVVRSAEGTFYTRNGQLQRDADGNLVTADGLMLQSDAGDVNVQSSEIHILADGTVLDDGEAVSRISVVHFEDTSQLKSVGDGLFSASSGAAHEVDDAQIRQGMLETSNVSTADEMLSIMSALRRAECGQHLVQAYDDLMGRVITTFGQN